MILLSILFLPYLWGIETCLKILLRRFARTFLPYLWGIETTEQLRLIQEAREFLPYLWGIETRLLMRILAVNSTVFTLPMRHWNRLIQEARETNEHGFYPTYEALKPFKLFGLLKPLWLFLPYLWGIETRICLAQVCFVESVFTLPMRHWNFSQFTWNIFSISFLPYLWGIETTY